MPRIAAAVLLVGVAAPLALAQGMDLQPMPAPLPDKPLEAVPTPPPVPPALPPKDQEAAPKTTPDTPPPSPVPPTNPAIAKRLAQWRGLPTEQLFVALKAATSEEEGVALENEIKARWLNSGSDTVDLLMSRALKAIAANQFPLALDLLDMIVMLRPDYAEAWTRRAGVHLARNDFAKGLADIKRAVMLEPRHFTAMTGLANMMEMLDDKAGALAIHRRILEFHPTNANSKREVEQLGLALDGRPS